MADSVSFAELAEQLEARTSLDRLEARGTLRIALKAAGLDAKTVEPHQLRVVAERVLPKELEARGIADADRFCQELALGVNQSGQASPSVDSPETIFDRMIGRGE